MNDVCICCGAVVPEGDWTCPNCNVAVMRDEAGDAYAFLLKHMNLPKEAELHKTETKEKVKTFRKKVKPTAKVVRCKNCQFSKYFEESGNWKCRSQKGLYRTVEPNDFCSWGERSIDG